MFKWRKPNVVDLPPGLVYHCEQCLVVVPADAPRAEAQDCVAIAHSGLTWFNARETLAGQFTMAAAAWNLIHHAALAEGHPECLEYHRQLTGERKRHFAKSEARKSMTPAQVRDESMHRRDGHLYR